MHSAERGTGGECTCAAPPDTADGASEHNTDRDTAHELSNLLGIVVAATQLIQESPDIPDMVLACSERILRAAGRASALVKSKPSQPSQL